MVLNDRVFNLGTNLFLAVQDRLFPVPVGVQPVDIGHVQLMPAVGISQHVHNVIRGDLALARVDHLPAVCDCVAYRKLGH